MPYKLILSAEAISELKKMENVTAKRILAKLESASLDPNHFFARLAGREDYKLRIGDYRAIAKILHNNKTINVISVGHRKNIYKK